MFNKHRDRKTSGPKHAANRDAASVGFTGLEGDFEAERRRAAAVSNDPVEPYEQGEDEKPVLPGKTAGLTHP